MSVPEPLFFQLRTECPVLVQSYSDVDLMKSREAWLEEMAGPINHP